MPEHYLWPRIKELDLSYLEIHNIVDGLKVFGVQTRYDWYVLRNQKYSGKTFIKDEVGTALEIDISEYPFLASYNIVKIFNLVAKKGEETCRVFYDATSYHNQYPHMQENKDKEHSFPCVYGMKKNGVMKCLYSSVDKGHFGVPKVILTSARFPYAFMDRYGEYGLTQNVFAIEIDTKKEGKKLVAALNSKKFSEIIKSTKWKNFQIDYKMFKQFRKDFWKDFI